MSNVSAGRLLGVLAAAVLTASCSATGGPPAPAPPVTAAPSGIPPGSAASQKEIATILKTLKVPGDGEVGFGRGRLWVENRKDQVLSLVDQSTATVARQIRGVLGGYMAIGDGVMWMSSFVLDALLRIDLDAGTVQTFDTGPGQAGTNAVVMVGEEVWAANHYTGTIVRVNDRGKVTKEITVSQPSEHGPQSMTTDGKSIWVSVPGDRAVVQVDPVRATVVRTTKVNGPVAGAMSYSGGRVWLTNGESVTEVYEMDASTGRVLNAIDLGGPSGRVIVAFGAVWVLKSEPNELVRIHPQTGSVVGRLPLPAGGNGGITASDGALWVRVEGQLLKLQPNT